MFLAVLEFVVYMLISYVAITQLAIPMYNGTLLFPAFRKRRKLEQEIAEAREEMDEVKIEKTVEQIKNQIEKEKNK